MDICVQSHIKSEVPPDVVRVVVNHDLVTSPHPVVAIANVIRGDAEIVPAKPEAARASSHQPPDMSPSETSSKVAVLPRVVEMVVAVLPARIMSDPPSIRVDVWSVGVPFRIAIIARFFVVGLWVPDPSGAVRRNILLVSLFLSSRWESGRKPDSDEQEHGQDRSKFIHVILQRRRQQLSLVRSCPLHAYCNPVWCISHNEAGGGWYRHQSLMGTARAPLQSTAECAVSPMAPTPLDS